MQSHSPRSFSPSDEKTLGSVAYARLRGDLIAGQFPPQARLRANELQAKYGFGLNPLREAMLRLASEGFIVSEGQKGFSVAPVSLSELQDLTRSRIYIETIALSESIKNGNTNWEAQLIASYHLLASEPMAKHPDDVQVLLKWESRHRAFHDALLAASQSVWLLRFHAQLVDHTARYLRPRLFQERPKSTVNPHKEHRAIMKAALQRDTPKAIALMTEHIEKTAKLAATWLASLKDSLQKSG